MRSKHFLYLVFTLLLGWTSASLADEASVRRAVESQLGVQVDDVARAGYGRSVRGPAG